MEKEVYLQGNYYEYYSITGYAIKDNRLILEDGRVVTRQKNKYTPDNVTAGSVSRHGYYVVKLEGSSVLVHRLVATHFIKNPENLPVVDHINENKLDNSVSNLRWLTLEDNTSRTNIRDDRALNEARATLLAAKTLYKQTVEVLEDIRKEEQEVEGLYSKVQYMKDLLTEEFGSKIEAYEVKLDTLLQIASARVKKAELAKLGTLHKQRRSKEQVIKDTGKGIHVAGVEFPSIRAATRFIVEEERKLGNLRKLATVRKELRTIQEGSRVEGVMYGVYDITRIQ